MKRGLGPRIWLPEPRSSSTVPAGPGLVPLVEGPVVGERPEAKLARVAEAATSEAKPYSRGSLQLALLRIQSDAAGCVQHTADKARAFTSAGPHASRMKSWATLGQALGHQNPSSLHCSSYTPSRGRWTVQATAQRNCTWTRPSSSALLTVIRGRTNLPLALAYRRAKRACPRGRGPAKQVHATPTPGSGRSAQLGLCADGPLWPGRATILASWWLLREKEASAALVTHLTVEQLVHWRLPSSKADWKALGATRTHSCSCTHGAEAGLCPFHAMKLQIRFASAIGSSVIFPASSGGPPSKAGWANTFEELARRLGLDTHSPSGLRLFTGHSARASGAVHLAHTQVELWRIQLFGRWGSDCFKQYVRDAPLSQLHGLAQEATLQTSLAAARAELAQLLQACEEAIRNQRIAS